MQLHDGAFGQVCTRKSWYTVPTTVRGIVLGSWYRHIRILGLSLWRSRGSYKQGNYDCSYREVLVAVLIATHEPPSRCYAPRYGHMNLQVEPVG